jgi:hypothetical protein
VEEAMKWSHPTYLKNGKIVLGTAALRLATTFKNMDPETSSG